MRTDLLALTLDDLMVLSNRGLVNRSLKELEMGTIAVTIAEVPDGAVEFQWSDGVICCLPWGAALSEECCSCSATQICRHLIRSILYYQRIKGSPEVDAPEIGSPEVDLALPEIHSEPVMEEALQASDSEQEPLQRGSQKTIVAQDWDPGEIPDAVLQTYYKPGEWQRLQQQYAQGQVMELSRGAKPTAYFHQWGITVRFMVPGDVRYVYCSCGEAVSEGEQFRLCNHLPLAVWGFRALQQQFPGQKTGLISTEVFQPIAPSVMEAVEAIVAHLLNLGLTHLSSAIVGELKRVQKGCEAEGLTWLGEIWGELLQQHTYYQKQDAQFEPVEVTELFMEAECRLRAMQNPRCPVPQLWIRGSGLKGTTLKGTALKGNEHKGTTLKGNEHTAEGDRADKSSIAATSLAATSMAATSIAATTLVGLGCGVRVGQQAVQLQVYVQDLKSGQVLLLRRVYPCDPKESPVPFAKLALKPGLKRFSLARLGSHQTITKGGKRLPNLEFQPGRNMAANLNPQNFTWENLRPPLLVDNLQLLQDHLAQSPPPALRPRRLTDNFWVITIAQVRAAEFSTIEQCVLAQMIDPQGHRLTLRHPYYDRGATGAEILLHLLQHYPDRLRFISGQVSPGAQGLEVQPVALILENPQGQRSMFQTWIDTYQTLSWGADWGVNEAGNGAGNGTGNLSRNGEGNDRPKFSHHRSESEAIPQPVNAYLTAYLKTVKGVITDLLLLGLETRDPKLLQQLEYCCQQGQSLGFQQLLTPLETLHRECRRKSEDPHWQAQQSRAAVRELLVWLSLADQHPKLSH